MFRLLKLMAYGLLGYAIYEFVRGATHGAEQARLARGNSLGGQDQSGSARGSGGTAGASGGDEGSRLNITGPGEGTPVATHDADGGSISHRVGRGVVAR